MKSIVVAVATTVAAVGLVPTAASAAKPSGAAARDTSAGSWFSGTVKPGRSQTHFFNVGGNDALHVGLSPVGATTDDACQFEVTKSWYVEATDGSRKFLVTIKNVGDIACGTNILLSALESRSIGSTRGVSPGDTVEIVAPDLDRGSNYLPAVFPSGATSSVECKFQVVGAAYRHVRRGDVSEFLRARVTVQNIGSVACTADVRLAEIEVDYSSSIGSIAAGGSKTKVLSNVNPLSKSYLPGLLPDLGCELEITRTYYRQRINSDGSAEREFVRTITNNSTVACAGKSVFTKI